ncbi:hypothetical protein A9G00_07960 [Achromobacter xylosoxidans]|nr:hypothetical protein A7P23_05840 [Achromobacter xylosoxidans]OCZ93213.1 hypothetical protein A9G00_07960 [Achromobacter xylosoxidans]
MPLKRDWIARAAIRLLPRVLAVNRIDNGIAIPTHHSICMLLQGFREIALLFAVLPNANDTLALLGCIFDFPVHPFTVLRARGDVADEHTGPVDRRSQYLRLDVVLVGRFIEFPRMDRGISNVNSFWSQQSFKLLQSGIVRMDVTDEYISLFCHLPPPFDA